MNFIKKFFAKLEARHQIKLGHSELKKKNFENSLIYYDRAIEKLENYSPSVFFRGLSYFNLQKWDKALLDFNKVKLLDPNQKETC